MGFRTVFIKNGERLKLRLDNLEIHKSGETFTIPLSDIEMVLLEGDQTTMTSRVLAKFSEHQIAVVICDQKYMPCGIYTGIGQYHRSSKRIQWQAGWEKEVQNQMWAEIIRSKIRNQSQVLEQLEKDEQRIELLKALMCQVEPGDITNREGHAAKVYFNTLFGQDFHRDDETFHNNCLNYGYAIIRAQTARCVVAVGLVPALGIFHKSEYNAYNLVDDLMEPFRPLLDWFVLNDIEADTDDFYLSYDTRLQLINFLNHKIMLRGRKQYISLAINEFVASFIKAMANNDPNLILDISLDQYLGCDRK